MLLSVLLVLFDTLRYVEFLQVTISSQNLATHFKPLVVHNSFSHSRVFSISVLFGSLFTTPLEYCTVLNVFFLNPSCYFEVFSDFNNYFQTFIYSMCPCLFPFQVFPILFWCTSCFSRFLFWQTILLNAVFTWVSKVIRSWFGFTSLSQAIGVTFSSNEK